MDNIKQILTDQNGLLEFELEEYLLNIVLNALNTIGLEINYLNFDYEFNNERKSNGDLSHGYIKSSSAKIINPSYFAITHYNHNSNNISIGISLPLYEDNSNLTIQKFIENLIYNLSTLAKEGLENINNILFTELKKNEIHIDNYTLLPISNSIELIESYTSYIQKGLPASKLWIIFKFDVINEEDYVPKTGKVYRQVASTTKIGKK